MKINFIDMRTEEHFEKYFDVTRFGITRTEGDEAEYNAFIASEGLVWENENIYKRETPLMTA